MALMACNECGKKISDEARNCPACGARNKKPVSKLTIVVVGLIAASFVGASINSDPENIKQPEKTAEEIAQEKAANIRKVAGIVAAGLIKESLRDPDSLKIEAMRVSEDGDIVCAGYRARNGFGGMNYEIAIFTPKGSSHEESDWNEYCTKPMYDVAASAE